MTKPPGASLFEYIRLTALILLLGIGCARASGQPMPYGAQSGALADAGVGLPASNWSLPNPANLGYLDAGYISFHAVQIFGLPELRLGAAQVSLPLKAGTIAINASSLGLESYRETWFQAGIATPLSFGTTRRVVLALMGAAKRVTIDGFGTAGVYGLSLGMTLQLAPEVYLGAVVQNHFQTNSVVQLPKRLMLGVAYSIASSTWIMASVMQEEHFSPALKLGVETRSASFLSLRYGFSSQPVKYAAGAGLHLHPVHIDLAVERHQILGWTHGISINLAITRRNLENDDAR